MLARPSPTVPIPARPADALPDDALHEGGDLRLVVGHQIGGQRGELRGPWRSGRSPPLRPSHADREVVVRDGFTKLPLELEEPVTPPPKLGAGPEEDGDRRGEPVGMVEVRGPEPRGRPSSSFDGTKVNERDPGRSSLFIAELVRSKTAPSRPRTEQYDFLAIRATDRGR